MSNQILIKFKPQGDKSLKTAINALAQAQERLNGSVNKFNTAGGNGQRAAKGFGGTLSVLRSKLLLANFAIAMGVKQLFNFGLAASKAFAETESLGTAFGSLTKANNFAVGTLEKLRESTNNLASDNTLLKQANNAMTLGVVRSGDEMSELFNIAQRLGRALGVDTTRSIESLVTGLGRQSRLMLDNVGIIVKADEAYKSYADSLGVSVDQLTQAERKTAFLNAGLEAAREKVKNLGEQNLLTQDSFSFFNAAVDNTVSVIGKKLAPIFKLAAKEYGELLNDLFGTSEEVVAFSDEIVALEKEQKRLTSQTEMYRDVLDGYQDDYKDVIRSIMELNPELVTEEQARGRVLNQLKLTQTQLDFLNKLIVDEKALYISTRGEREADTELRREQTDALTKYSDTVEKANAKFIASQQKVFEGTKREVELNQSKIKFDGQISQLTAQNTQLLFDKEKANDSEKKHIEEIISLNEKTQSQLTENAQAEQDKINRKHDLIDAMRLENFEFANNVALQENLIDFASQREIAEIKLDELQKARHLTTINNKEEQLKLDKEIASTKGLLISLDRQEANEKQKLAAKTVGALADINDAFKGSTKATIRLRQVQAAIDAYASYNMQLVESKLPAPLNIVAASLSLAAGLANIRRMSSEAGDKFEQGGLVGGRRHSQGGTMIEAERGEFVMSRRAVQAVGVEAMNRINQGGGAGAVNISFAGNVMSQDFIEDEAIPMIKEAIRRGADIGVS